VKKNRIIFALIIIAMGIAVILTSHKETATLGTESILAFEILGVARKVCWSAVALFGGALLGSYAITILSRRRAKKPIISFDFKKIDYEAEQSHCFVCGAKLRTRDVLSIISYLVYRGRCKYCGAKIGAETIIYESPGLLLGVAVAVFAVWGISL